MNNRPRRPFLHWLHSTRVAEQIDLHHITHCQFADHLGLSRSYWSQLYNRRRPLTPMVRACLLGSRYLEGLAESELWDRVSTAAAKE